MDQKDVLLGTCVSNLGIGVPKLGTGSLILENRDSNLDVDHSTLSLEGLNFHQKAPTEGQKDETIDEQHTNFK